MAEYLTIDGVAELTGRTPHAIRKLVERGLIPYRKHNKLKEFFYFLNIGR